MSFEGGYETAQVHQASRQRGRGLATFTGAEAGAGDRVRQFRRAAMPNASEVLVYINEDGSVRELTEADKKYVDTEFSPFDGARPYIKLHYSQRTALGEIRGYLPRTEVPEGMPINPAPSEHEPEHQTSQTVAELISELIRKHTQN
jgi:hypothetical protein